MKRLSDMSREELKIYINSGVYRNQDILDLYDDLIQREAEIDDLKHEIEMHRSNYDATYWEEREQEMREDGVWD